MGRTDADPRLIEYTLFAFDDPLDAEAAALLAPALQPHSQIDLDGGGTFGFVVTGGPMDDPRADFELLPHGPPVDGAFRVQVAPDVVAVGGTSTMQPTVLAALTQTLTLDGGLDASSLPDGMQVLVADGPLGGTKFELSSSYGKTIVEVYLDADRSWFEYFSWTAQEPPSDQELVEDGTEISLKPPSSFAANGAAIDPARTVIWADRRLTVVTHPNSLPPPDLAGVVSAFAQLDDVAVQSPSEDQLSDAPTETESDVAADSFEAGEVGVAPTAAEMAILQDYVERARGIEAGQPIAFDFVDDFPTEGVGARFLTSDLWLVAVALGLTDEGQTLDGANQARIDRIRGTPGIVALQPTRTETDVVVVHEMVHVIDPSPFVRREPELVSLGQAVSEGNAHRIAFDYLRTLPQDEQAHLLPFPHIFDPDGDERISRAVQDLLEFPYDEGRVFMAEIADRGGEQLVEQVFRRPPVSSEQLLYVDAWQRDDQPERVEPPSVPAGAEVEAVGSLGVYLLLLVAADAGLADDGLAVLSQWSGDRLVAYRLADQACVAAAVAMDTGEAAADLAAILRAGGNLSAETQGRVVSVDSCR